MGLLIIGVLAGILVGFGVLGASQGHFLGCNNWQGCFDKAAVSQPLETRHAALKADTAEAQAKSPAPAKSAKQASVKSHKRRALAKEATKEATKETTKETAKETTQLTRIRVPAPDRRPTEKSDPVLNNAKATVAAKMEVPTSAEFGDMDRAIRLNTFGRPVDTICGHVRGKDASGGDTGERAFLYLVKEDDAYVVDGKPESAAAIAYRNICRKN